jgi:hypothetical protein
MRLLTVLLACTGAGDDDSAAGADSGSGTDTADSGDTGADVPEPLTDGFGALLTNDVGCADVSLYAYAPDGTLVLTFRIEGAATAAHDAGGAITTTYALADAGADGPDVYVRQGTYLSDLLCNDVIEHDPVELRRWLPVAGSATLTVEPTGERTDWGEVPARADLVLEALAFVPEDDPTAVPVLLGELTISSGVGWMPG